jgi:hypothetical protein
VIRTSRSSADAERVRAPIHLGDAAAGKVLEGAASSTSSTTSPPVRQCPPAPRGCPGIDDDETAGRHDGVDCRRGQPAGGHQGRARAGYRRAARTGPAVVACQHRKLESEKVVVAAPLSYAGSAARIWKLTGMADQTGARIALGVAAVVLIVGAWCFVTAWYLFWGLFLVPYGLIRRGSRKHRREALQHREMLAAIQARTD